MNKQIEVKAYTMKQLSVIYGVSDRTLRRWFNPFQAEIGERNGHFYTVNQVRVIFEKIGIPGME